MNASLTTNCEIQPSLVIMPDKLLRLSQVMEIVALGKTMIYRLVNEGQFPKPLKPGGNATRWSEAEIFGWLAEQSAARASC